MKITFDDDIIKTFPFSEAHKREIKDIYEIVIHHTEGEGNFKSLKAWMLGKDNSRTENYKKSIGFTQYYMDKDGSVTQLFDNEFWTYHSSCGIHDKNTIGIEVVHLDGEFTDEQYENLPILIEKICNECRIITVTSHDFNYLKYSKKVKGCPGAHFSWDRLRDGLIEKNIKVKIEAL